MEGFIAVSFHDRRRAAEAFNLLWQMNDKSMIELDDAVIVHRDRYGNLEYDQDFASTLDRRLMWAGLRGGLLGTFIAASFTLGTNATLDRTVLCACYIGRRIDRRCCQSVERSGGRHLVEATSSH
jgi:hypothetical protein